MYLTPHLYHHKDPCVSGIRQFIPLIKLEMLGCVREPEQKLEVCYHRGLKIIHGTKTSDLFSSETVHYRCDNMAMISAANKERRLMGFGRIVRHSLHEISVAAIGPEPLPT
ncbi:unnamed protein product [Schistocephalus solidus]|uniref:GNAT family N-acetyltransferase n=1 Tax=Schistocephalus solidus TaxID=70667 RepID=A0A183TEL6_SCHSO|nr:unnamed protein product [Schistocephalus solidus]